MSLGRDVLARDEPLDVGRDGLGLRALVRAAPERDLAGRASRQRLAARPRRRSARRPRAPRRAICARRAVSSAEAHDGRRPATRRGSPRGSSAAAPRKRCDRLIVVARRPSRCRARRPAAAAAGPAAKLGSWKSSTSTWRKRAASARAHVRLARSSAERVQHEVAGVERARLGEHPVVRGVDRGELALALGARAPSRLLGQRRRPARRSRRRVISSSLSRSMRCDDEPSSAPGCRGSRAARSVSSSIRSSSIASRSAGVTGAANGSMPASSASSRSSRAQKPWNVVDVTAPRSAVGHARLDARAQRVGRAGRVRQREDRLRPACPARPARRSAPRARASCRCPAPPSDSSGPPAWVTAVALRGGSRRARAPS